MSGKRNLSGMMREILNKANSLPGLSEDERDCAFRTYRLLYNIKLYRQAPIVLGILFALTGCFLASGIIMSILGINNPNLIYVIAGLFLVGFILSYAILRIYHYDKWLKAEISGFEYAMEHNPKIMTIVKLIKAHDPQMARTIHQYLI